MKSAISAIASLLLLVACADSSTQLVPTEVLHSRDWVETLVVEGEIRAATNTPLMVPGEGWENRALLDMVPDGSIVRRGEVVARFDSPRARMELSQAEAELMRKLLSEANIVATTAMSRAEVATDSAKVEMDLALSNRYANADLSYFARNQILDALQDVKFLTTKHGYLNWKGGQLDRRGQADHAVVQSQKESVELTAAQKRKSLAALELIAPHDGVFQITTRWDGTKPQIGASLWTGQEFGSLPNIEKLQAHFSVPESQTFALKVGLPVRVRLAGTGVEIEATVTSVGSSATAKSRDSPVKYIEFDAAFDAAEALRLQLRPRQAVQGVVRLIERKNVLTVPNVALVQESGNFAVIVVDGRRHGKQAVELGVRGPIRSEIKSGAEPGTVIALLPDAALENR